MSDPLAGKRERINSGEAKVLAWADDGSGQPVQVGQVFGLRKCAIEITLVRRQRQGGQFKWLAHFTRFARGGDRINIPGKTGEYVHSPDGAGGMRDSFPAEMPDWTVREILDVNQGVRPPEIEAVDSDEVGDLPSTVQANTAYLAERAEDVKRRIKRSLIEEIRTAGLSTGELEQLRLAVAAAQEDRQVAA